MTNDKGQIRLKRLQMYLCLVPVFGAIPALWTLSTKQGDREQQSVSRLAITLALGWLLAYSLLSAGAGQTAEIIRFRLLFLDSLLASGYVLVCLGLMLRLWQRKPVRLPGVSRWADRMGQKRRR
ncbi:MAG: hypothetical protein SW833_02600 [Cyanobacteriota bacterium]|nr:hypothetical protein [Cyanobacteriota bacterium]